MPRHITPPPLLSPAFHPGLQGNCTEAPSQAFLDRLSGAPLAARTPRQCLLLAQNHLLAITQGKALVENLYIRYPSGGGGFGFEEPTAANVPMLLHVHGGDVYIRDVRVEGDGRTPCRGFIAYPTARVLYEGVTMHTMHACVCGGVVGMQRTCVYPHQRKRFVCSPLR